MSLLTHYACSTLTPGPVTLPFHFASMVAAATLSARSCCISQVSPLWPPSSLPERPRVHSRVHHLDILSFYPALSFYPFILLTLIAGAMLAVLNSRMLQTPQLDTPPLGPPFGPILFILILQ